MPVQHVSKFSKSKKKEDVSQKIQEIKQRQQNWLKQREKSKQEEANEKSKTAPLAHSKPTVNRRSEEQNSEHGTRKNVIVQENSNVREKFRHWIDARNASLSLEEDIPDVDCNSFGSAAESELERLVSPEQCSVSQPVPEEDFDYLAEKIANRVKEDLGIPLSSAPLEGTPSTLISLKDSRKPTWDSDRGRTFTQEEPTFLHNGTPTFRSHSCTVCKKLMLSSKNIPTMVIPCGHNFCRSCLEGKKVCPSCNCPVLSLTVNIMLQQVIQEYHSNVTPSDFTSVYLESTGSSNGSIQFQTRHTEDNHGNHKDHYKTRLENLQMRQEILVTEQNILLTKQNQVTKRLQQEHTQSLNIKRQEDEIEKSISDLQVRLKGLKELRKQCECHLVEVKEEKTQIEDKITLTSTTLASLVKEIEKVRLLSESEGRENNS